MIYWGIAITQKLKLVNTDLNALSANTDTYGKKVNKASVIPRPARNTGVRPILGLIVEPMKDPTGDSYVAPQLESGYWLDERGSIPRTWALPRGREWLRWQG